MSDIAPITFFEADDTVDPVNLWNGYLRDMADSLSAAAKSKVVRASDCADIDEYTVRPVNETWPSDRAAYPPGRVPVVWPLSMTAEDVLPYISYIVKLTVASARYEMAAWAVATGDLLDDLTRIQCLIAAMRVGAIALTGVSPVNVYSASITTSQLVDGRLVRFGFARTRDTVHILSILFKSKYPKAPWNAIAKYGPLVAGLGEMARLSGVPNAIARSQMSHVCRSLIHELGADWGSVLRADVVRDALLAEVCIALPRRVCTMLATDPAASEACSRALTVDSTERQASRSREATLRAAYSRVSSPSEPIRIVPVAEYFRTVLRSGATTPASTASDESTQTIPGAAVEACESPASGAITPVSVADPGLATLRVDMQREFQEDFAKHVVTHHTPASSPGVQM